MGRMLWVIGPHLAMLVPLVAIGGFSAMWGLIMGRPAPKKVARRLVK